MDITPHEKKVYDSLTQYYINSVLILENPEIENDFPEFPGKIPKELIYKATSKNEAIAAKKRANTRKVEKDAVTKKKEKLEVEDIGSNGIRSARKTRFTGHYTFEIPDETDDEDCFVNTTVKKEDVAENDKKETEFFTALNMMRTKSNLSVEQASSSKSLCKSDTFVVKKVKTLSDTSSSDEEENSSFRPTAANNLPTTSSVDRNEALILKLNRPINGKTIPKIPSNSRPDESIKKSQEVKKATNGYVTNRKVKPVKPLVQNSEVLKSAFKESSNFDEAMKKYSKRNKEIQQKFVKAKIIPPPEQDPMIKKLKRIPKKIIEAKQPNLSPKNSKEHLGGIFTIHNGWDKEEQKNESSINQEVRQNGKVLERRVSKPKIVIENPSDDVMEAHSIFMDDDFLMQNMLMPQLSSSTSSCHSNKSDCGSPGCSKMCENNGTVDAESDEELKPKKKIQRLSYSDDENETENVNGHQEDVLTLCADMGDFDDFEEETNNQIGGEIMTEVDDLKLKFVKPSAALKPLDHKTEFDLNTKQISQHIVDPETDKILKTYFGDVCPAFLENRCSMPNCTKRHSILDESKVRPLIINASFSALSGVFQVSMRFHRLFRAYVPIFAEYCVKTKDDFGLIQLVKTCDKHPRTISCYKDIERVLIEKGYMTLSRAINFIIDHHTDSPIARETILSMIIMSGPTLVYFMPYIEKIHRIHPISMDLFNIILDTCVAYQNPHLPKFCLDFLDGCSSAQMQTLNKNNLSVFIRLNKCLMELNEHREAKTMSLLQKIL